MYLCHSLFLPPSSLPLYLWSLALSFSNGKNYKVHLWCEQSVIDSETGWDLGPFAAGLHLDTPLLKQQNSKKLYGTKNNCMYVQLGQLTDKKIQKTKKKKKSYCHFWRVWSKIWVLRMPPAHSTTLAVGKTPKSPLQPDLWTHPYPHPIWGTSSGSEQAGELVLCSPTPLLQQGTQ